MDGYDAFTFACMVLVLPLFVVVLAVSLLVLTPVLLPMWLWERRNAS
jgi:hypothetical protein